VPASVTVDGWSVGRPLQVTAVRYHITDARPLFPRSLSWLYSLLYLTTYSILFGTRSLTANFQAVVLALAVSSSGNLSVSVLQWLTLTQSSRGWQEGQQMILLSISGGRRSARLNASRSFSGLGYCTGSSTPNNYLRKGVTLYNLHRCYKPSWMPAKRALS